VSDKDAKAPDMNANTARGQEAAGMRQLLTVLGTPMDVGAFLQIAVAIAAELARLHQQKITHKSINPRCILIGPESGSVTITGVSAAPNQHPPPESSQKVAPEYMSPEQTGRLNRPVDYRTDFYSLGITFYQMLTGGLPFQRGDLLELVYNHIARLPAPPREVVPEIPRIISDIVMRLVAKNPEERYQTASGVKFDLGKCLAQWKEQGTIEEFPLGEGDLPDRLAIPAKLYGRDREIATLVDAFKRVAETGKAGMVMVAGYSGSGKTSLVQELYPPVVRSRGYFISGKFDQYQRAIPYSTIAEAFRELIRQVLTENEERILGWKGRIQKSLGNNGQLIVKVIPELELIIGPQPPVTELSAAEAQNRFSLFFRRFMGVFADQEHPLVIFLDDLQWVNSTSLKLIEEVVTHSGTKYLLLIGAYRDNEVTPSHPLMLTLNDVRRRGATLDTIKLSALSIEDLGRLMTDTFRSDLATIEPLTRLVFEKTAGNPFFAIQFLGTLDQEGLLYFDSERRRWRWDIPGIRSKNYTDNVAQLIAGRLERLPAESRQALATAACLGDSFELSTLALVEDQAPEAMALALGAAEREAVLLRLDGSYKFLHDRVREAAYALIAEEKRAEIHLHIGRVLYAEMDERLFDVASHFNQGLALISDQEERRRVAELDLLAGRKAKASSAYPEASAFLASGAELLGEEGWRSEYQLAMALCLERAECEYLRGRFAEAGPLLDLALHRARSRAEKAAAYRARIELYTVTGDVEQAVGNMLECATLFGLALERHPAAETVQEAYAKVAQSLGKRSIEELAALPTMSDEEVRALSEALMAASPAVTNYDHRLHFAIIAETVRLSIQYGSAPCSLAAYVHFGTEIGPLLGEYLNGYRFGKLAYDLVERDGLVAYEARCCGMFAYGILPWTRHVGSALPYLRKGVRAGSEAGDLIFACFCCACIVSVLLARGDALDETAAEAASMLDFVESVGYGDVEDSLLILRRFVLRLRGLAPVPAGEAAGDDLDARILGRFPTAVFWYHVRTLQERFLFGDYREALSAARRGQELLWTATHHWESCEHSYYLALTLAALYSGAAQRDRDEYLRCLREELERYRVWAENAPQNFLNRHALLAAETARLEGRDQEAMVLYERAVTSARENGFLQNEALANEVAAGFYQERGLLSIAHAYLRQARACYLRWKADAKVRQLDRRHPWLKEEALLQKSCGAGTAGEVDAITVVKASMAISGEIELRRLMDALMRITLENAGARKGYLLLPAGEELKVEACAMLEGEEIRMVEPAPIPIAELVPQSMVNLVRRTRERVILEDASERSPFSSDPYLVRHKPVSVLCIPILRQADLAAVLYLENDLVRGAFTAQRVGILEVLVAQAALSLENARIYEALREAEAKYRSIFENALEGIFRTTPAGRFLDANPAMARILGYASSQELLAQVTEIRSQLYVEPRERDQIAQLLEERGVVQEMETRLRRKDGSVIWVLINARSVRDNDGRVLCFEGIAEDVSAHKAAEEELLKHREHLEHLVRERTGQLEQANLRLKDLDRLKSMFIASMSHELRTPLNAIIGFTGMTLDGLSGGLNAEQEDNLSRAYHSAQHLLELITDIIDISKIESGRIDTFPEVLILGEVVDEAIGTVATVARQKGLNLEVRVPAAIKLTTDRKRLLQCLINLLGNAVKFTEQGKITVLAKESQGFLELSVIDTGIGISREDLPKLFEPFERLESRLRVRAGGTGLGLYLTRKLARDVLHGTVSVESREGEGSVFTLRIPLNMSLAAEYTKEGGI